MTLKALTFGTLAASTLALASTVVSPAEAATVTGGFDFGKAGGVSAITNSKIDFVNTDNFFTLEQGTGTFAGLVNSRISILNDITVPFSGPLDFLRVENGVNDILFQITRLENIDRDPVAGAPAFSANIFGNFIFEGDSTPARPSSLIFALSPRTGGFTNVSVEAVPTPALLPAIVGMGIAAVRKRKSAESVVESADA
jgi:hypothetical protein